MSGKVLEKSAYGVKYVPRRDDSSDESFDLSDYDDPEPIQAAAVPKRKKKSPVAAPKAEVRKPARALVTLAPSAETPQTAQPKIMRGRQVDVLRHRAEAPRPITPAPDKCFGAEAVLGKNPAALLGNCERVGRLQLLRADTETVLSEYYSKLMGQIADHEEVAVEQLQQIDRVPRARSRSRSRKPAAKPKKPTDTNGDSDEDKPKKPKKPVDNDKPKKAAAKRAAKPAAKKAAKK